LFSDNCLYIGRWNQRAKERHDISLEWNEEVVSKLTEGYNIQYGARSIKHEVERRVINQIARAHEQDQVGEGSKVKIVLDGGEIKLNVNWQPKQTSSRLKFW
jgi:ATP-dependent Clp protease ATP-binding subunit ClpB